MQLSKYRRWTKKEDELLKKLYDKKTLNELGDIFNRHWNKVCRRAILLGIKKDKKIVAKRLSKIYRLQFANGIRSNKGKNNPNWKGGNRHKTAGIDEKLYYHIHWWLLSNFGKANKCENKDCLKKSISYQWAKLRHKKYEKKRENFIMLCKSCHCLYDLNEKYDITKN